MSKPTKEEINSLKEHHNDDEFYHVKFDALLEAKLKELDPEWISEMLTLYKKSGMHRWCA